MGLNFLKIRNGATLNPQGAPTSPQSGDIYFDSTANTYLFYQNGAWINLASRVDVPSAASLTSSALTAAVVQNSLIRITGSTASTLSGLTAGGAAKQVVIYNQSSSTMIVNNQDATEPTPANRILTYNSGSATVLSGQVISLVYDDNQSRWILASSPGTGGSGSGVGDDVDSLTFRASFNELFADSPTSTTTSVNTSAGFTNATYSAAKNMWTLSYDASKTIAAGTGSTTVVLSSAASYTVVTGDMVIVGTQAVKITNVNSQSNFTVETLSSVPSNGTQVTVSQAVHTKDIYNLAVDGSAISAAFPGTVMSEFMVDYKDNNVTNSNLFTPDVGPYAGFTISADNSNWTSAQYRPVLDTTQIQSAITPTSGSSAYIRFFANKSSGSGIVNLIMYKAFMQKLAQSGSGGILWSAYGTTNNSTTPVNCTIGTIGGLSTITLTNGNQYAVAVNPGQTYGSVDVYLNGQLLPRYVAGSVPSTDAYYNEVSGTVIQLDRDYSGSQLDVQVVQRTQSVDTSTTNTTQLAANQSGMTAGFQGFVSQTDHVITATSSVGTPAAGTFYSTIVGRASLPDLSQDLQVRFGLNRFEAQQLIQLQTEVGPSGQLVSSITNDTFGQVRFVGSWFTQQATNGSVIITNTNNDYVEVTFYGTGLNVLLYNDANARSITAAVDGGSAGSNIVVSNSSVLVNRNYAQNAVTAAVSGLALGIHTITLNAANAANSVIICGFEIINQNATPANLSVNPGIGYVGGQKLVNSSQLLQSYAAPVVGNTGGRVVVYESSSGSIGTAFTACATSPSYIGSASHTNEEVVRWFSPREFGAGRGDDFSGNVPSGNNNLAFTLDDGDSTLSLYEGFINNTNQAISFNNIANSYLTLTFIGSGVDLVGFRATGTSVSLQVFIDGNLQGTLTTSSTTAGGVQPIASGLPYGTHTLKLFFSASGGGNAEVQKFIVYQPKTPSIPSGAIQLGSYNVLANYSFNSGGQAESVSQGVMRKFGTREVTYVGSWSATLTFPYIASGWLVDSTTSGNSAQYTFFGTGFEWQFFTATGSAMNVTVSVDGSSNLSSYTTHFQGASTGLTFTASTGNISGTSAGQGSSRLSVTNLPLGLHTIQVTQNGNSQNCNIDCFDIVTPVHSWKSNLFADFQNTLTVGSNAISDDRQTQPVKNTLPVYKAWVQATGINSSPTSTATVFVPVPDMSVTIKTSGGALQIFWGMNFNNTSSSGANRFMLYVDGTPVPNSERDWEQMQSPGYNEFGSDMWIIPVGPGVHKVDLYWETGPGNTIECDGTQRVMSVREI